MAGRRDFGELSAKLEKHLERLPDYAQRAQEKVRRAQEALERYLPAGTTEGQQRTERQHQAKSVARPSAPAEIPVVAEVRAKLAQWNDPAAKLERRKRRSSRALTLWIVLVLLCGLYAFLAGFVTGVEVEALAAGSAGVIVFGALAVRSGMRLRELKATPVPARTAPPALPPASSAAHEPMRRLAECEASLTELLRQLSEPSSAGTTAVPEISVEDARNTATEAAKTLRALAARIQAVERARNAAPDGERAALDAAVQTLREQLDDGLDGYGALVAAAGRALAASNTDVRQSQDALTDATDRLAGLAIALRDLS